MPEEFDVNGTTVAGYLALPERGHGPGVLVLHAWWGLTPFFEDVCERLATEGFVAFAPDRYGGPTAATIEEAEALQLQREGRGRHCVPPGARRGSTPTLASGTGSSRRIVVATTKLRQLAWLGNEPWTSCAHTSVRTNTRQGALFDEDSNSLSFLAAVFADVPAAVITRFDLQRRTPTVGKPSFSTPRRVLWLWRDRS